MGHLEKSVESVPSQYPNGPPKTRPLELFSVFSLCLAAQIFVHSEVLTTAFGHHNDFSIFTYNNKSCCWGFPESSHLVAIGRWFGALLLNQHFRALTDIDSFTTSRWIAVFFTAVSAAWLTIRLRKSGLSRWNSVAVSIALFLLPGQQLFVHWITNFIPGTFAIGLSLCGVAAFDRATDAQRYRPRVLWTGLTIFLLILGNFIYPPSAAFFLVPVSADLLFSGRSPARAVLAMLLADVLYFAIQSAGIRAGLATPLGPGTSYAFEAGAQWVQKAKFFFLELSPVAWNLWITPPAAGVAIGVVLLTASGFLSKREHRRGKQALMWMGILGLIANLPILAGTTNIIGYRLLVTYSAMIYLMALEAFGHSSLGRKTLPGLGLLLALAFGRLNSDTVAANDKKEFEFIKTELLNLWTPESRAIFLIRPIHHTTFVNRPLAYDFNFTISSYYPIGGGIIAAGRQIFGTRFHLPLLLSFNKELCGFPSLPAKYLVLDMNRNIIQDHFPNHQPEEDWHISGLRFHTNPDVALTGAGNHAIVFSQCKFHLVREKYLGPHSYPREIKDFLKVQTFENFESADVALRKVTLRP